MRWRHASDDDSGDKLSNDFLCIHKNKVSTGNAETMSAMEKLRDRRDCVREGTMKQRDVKATKATHFRSETESLRVDEQKSMRPHEYRRIQ